MKHTIQAEYGDSMQLAVQKALAARDRDAAIFKRMNISCSFSFDFHGIVTELTTETTAEQLLKFVGEVLQERAALFELMPVPPHAFEQEQHGRHGEHLSKATTCAVQCGQRWGNRALELTPQEFETMRHVFEFNGIRVSFNPWKTGEDERVAREVDAALQRKGAAPNEYYVRPTILPATLTD